jgi:hypothetical protein
MASCWLQTTPDTWTFVLQSLQQAALRGRPCQCLSLRVSNLQNYYVNTQVGFQFKDRCTALPYI